MCLAVPGRIVSITEGSGEGDLAQMGRVGDVEFSQVIKQVSLAYVPEAVVGDYVLVHVGFAISRVDEEEAQAVFETLRQIEECAEGGPAHDR